MITRTHCTAVLLKTSHANSCTTLTNRPSRGRRGRFVRVVQQVACEVFERPAVAPHACSGPQSPSFDGGCHSGLQGWACATCGMSLIGKTADLHPRDVECFTMYHVYTPLIPDCTLDGPARCLARCVLFSPGSLKLAVLIETKPADPLL